MTVHITQATPALKADNSDTKVTLPFGAGDNAPFSPATQDAVDTTSQPTTPTKIPRPEDAPVTPDTLTSDIAGHIRFGQSTSGASHFPPSTPIKIQDDTRPATNAPVTPTQDVTATAFQHQPVTPTKTSVREVAPGTPTTPTNFPVAKRSGETTQTVIARRRRRLF